MAAGAGRAAGNGGDGGATLETLSLDLIRIATALADLGAHTGDTLSACPLIGDSQIDCPHQRHRLAALIAERQARTAAFGQDLAHPGWSLLLELYRAHLASSADPEPVEACPEPVEGGIRLTRLAAAARVSLTSTLRWLKRLEAAGLIKRRPDPTHETAVLVSLTEAGVKAMAEHFEQSNAARPLS
jgi:DNA-binding MarR family transcriptional regulator